MKNKIDELMVFLGGKKIFGIVAGVVMALYLIAGIAVMILKI